MNGKLKWRNSAGWYICSMALIVVLFISAFCPNGRCEGLSAVPGDAASAVTPVASGINYPDGLSLLMRMLGSLALVSCLIIGVVFLLRRYVFGRNGTGNAGGEIKVLSTTFLGPKKSIYLVRVLNRILVLGVSESQMQTLSEFTSDEAEDLLPDTQQEIKEQPFSKILHTLMGHTKG